MAVRSSEYWQKRFEAIEDLAHKKAKDTYKEVEKVYKSAMNNLEEDISVWYQRFADNNQIELADARKLLNAEELAELKWSVDEYIKYGKENAINQKWMKELENASARFHISRLESLQLQVRNCIEELYHEQGKAVPRLLEDVYQDGYYHSIFEFQKGLEIGFTVASIDKRQLEKVLSKPWVSDGKTFSDRIWTNKDKLIKELHDDITRATMLGRNPNELVKDFARKMETSKSNARRLIMTETSFFNSASHKDAFAELDIEEFEICATLDNKTSQLCRDLDGKHFPMKDYSVGLNAPPFHVYCRTTTCPYFDDEFTADEVRIARDENGKNYKVPANMNYREWEKTFVGRDVDYMSNSFKPQYGESQDIYVGEICLDVKPVKNSTFNMVADTTFTKRNKAVRLTEKNLNLIKNDLPNDFEMPRIAVIDFEKHKFKHGAIGGYDVKTDTVFINSKYNTSGKILEFVNHKLGYFANTTEKAVYLHELGHKYHHDTAIKLAKKEGISYTEAKKVIDEDILDFISMEMKNNKKTLISKLSIQANKGYAKRKTNEIVAECFTVRDGNEFAKEILELMKGW